MILRLKSELVSIVHFILLDPIFFIECKHVPLVTQNMYNNYQKFNIQMSNYVASSTLFIVLCCERSKEKRSVLSVAFISVQYVCIFMEIGLMCARGDRNSNGPIAATVRKHVVTKFSFIYKISKN